MIDLEKLRRSLKHLEVQLANWHRAELRLELTALDREGLGESVIQRFETCYDSLWKALKRYLEQEIGLADTPNGPKPILKLAGQSEVLPSAIEQWLRYANARIATSHDYSGEKAADCLLLMDDFTADAIALFETISGASWT